MGASHSVSKGKDDSSIRDGNSSNNNNNSSSCVGSERRAPRAPLLSNDRNLPFDDLNMSGDYVVIGTSETSTQAQTSDTTRSDGRIGWISSDSVAYIPAGQSPTIFGASASASTSTSTQQQPPHHQQCDIYEAVATANVRQIRYILGNGIDVDVHTPDDGYTPLHEACSRGHKEIVELLISEYNASPELANNEGITALHCAIIGRHASVGDLLLNTYRVSPNVQTKEGYTPLHYAAFLGDLTCALLLVEAGARTNIEDNEGHSPLQVARSESQDDIKNFLEECTGTTTGDNAFTVEQSGDRSSSDDSYVPEIFDGAGEGIAVSGDATITDNESKIREADNDEGLEHLPELERKIAKLQRAGCDFESDFPPSCICPITYGLMTEPVVTADGYTYEKSAIEDWLKQSSRSPQTNEELQHKNTIPNRNMKADIAERVDQKMRELGMSTR
eukprot:gb/GECG01000746.1/.p1 GENE.gb/GECG01000746.1/~~gb/GECG01000746.1/.p1  ORF type:complete len:446 (+),score=57.30 gb/GECG01000746.1/:1-1338(+)